MVGHVKISVVVPCLNEEAVLPRFHDAITQEAEQAGLDFELLYVDDGSADATGRLLKSLSGRDRRVRYLSLSRNFGKEAAMFAGLEHAGGDAVILIDADLQHPPNLVPRMVELYRRGFDQVVARRDRRQERVGHALLARLYYRLVNQWIDVRLVDGAGDFRLLSRRAVDALLSLPEYNRFSKGLFAWIGFDTAVIEYHNVAREDGRSKWTLRKLVNYGMDGLVSFNNRPLRFAIHLGMLMTALSLCYLVWVIGGAFARGVDTPGYVTLMTAIIAFSGLQIMMLGIIGEYIGRIYYETKRRPHYLLKDATPQVSVFPAPRTETVPEERGDRSDPPPGRAG
jgi:polyisoprenyl-phosphate glycosyltransferase